MEWKIRLGWNYLYLAVSVVFFLMFWNSLIRRRLFSLRIYLSSALQWTGPIGTGFSGALCSVTVSLPMSEWRLLNTVALKNVTADFISVNGFYQARNTAQKKGNIFFRYISSSALRRKNDCDYCHTVLKSYFFCSNCWVSILSKCVCFSLYFWEDGEMWVCVHAGYWERAQLCFSSCEPHSRGRVGCKELSGQDLAPQSRIERGGDIQHSQ